MSYTNQTTHYGLPLPTQTDLVNGLDNNDAFERIDTAIYSAEQAATTATQDITGIRATIAQLQNADVTFQSELTGVTARVSTLEENETTVVEDIQDTQDMITAREVPSAQSDKRILVGEWFRYNGVLYVCTVQIEIGDTIVPNVNCRASNVETEVTSGGTSSIAAANVTFDDSVAQIGETNVQAALVALKALIDNLGGGYMKTFHGTVAPTGATATVDISALNLSSPDDYFVILNAGTLISQNAENQYGGIGCITSKTTTSFTISDIAANPGGRYASVSYQVVYNA